MTGRKLSFISIIFALWSSAALGISINTSVDTQQLELGSQLTLTITIDGEGSSIPDPTLPDLSDFDVYSSGRNQSISMTNGRFQSTVEMNYILTPKKTGILIIGPVIIKDKKIMASSEPIKIVVSLAGQAGKIPQSRQGKARGESPQKTEDFFIEQTVDKKNPYIGEQITLTFRFYRAANLWDGPSMEWPKYVGFVVEDLPPQTQNYRVVNGKRYHVTEIKRALFPISTGEAVIETPTLTINPDPFGAMRDPFSMFGRGSKRSSPKVLTARSIRLNVRALPQKGRPDYFNGAVGRYNIKIGIDKDSVGVDEPITMKITLYGTGNIKSLPSVDIPDLPDFRVYESGRQESVNNSGGVVSGSIVFEQAIIPVTSGEFTVPALKYSYFDPGKNSYVTIAAEPINIIASGEGLTDVGGAPKNIIAAGKKSFGYIITEFPGEEEYFDLFGSPWFWILQITPVFGIAGSVLFRKHYIKLMGDRAYARRFGAGRRSKRIFKSAARRKKTGDYPGFYAEIYDFIVGFIADRLNLGKSALTLDDIRSDERIDQTVRLDLIAFLEKCQTARFAPFFNDENHADQLLNEASDLSGRLEKLL